MTPSDQERTGDAIAALVRAQKGLLIQRWQQRVLREVSAAGKQEPPALVDALPDFLEHLALTLEETSLPRHQEQTTHAAREHGSERANLPGYTLDQVIFEYQVLREVLVETLEAQGRVAPQVMRRLHAGVDLAIREASVRFVERSQESLGRAERSSRFLEHLLDQIFASFNGAMVYFSGPDFVFERVNARYREILHDRDLVGRPVLEAVPELAASNFPAIFQKLFTEGGTAFFAEEQVNLVDRQSGQVTTRYFDGSYSRIEDAEGHPLGIFHFATEVTERVAARQEALETAARAQAEVEAAKTRLTNLVQNAPVFICAQEGPQHIYRLANPLYQQLVGEGRPLLGLPVREALPEVVEQGFADLLDRVYTTGEPFVGTERPVQLRRQEGGALEQTLLNFVYQPRRDAQGLVEGIDTFGFDVTELVRARQRAELLSQQMADRADFEQQLIGIVSHDLRNPLSAILLGTSLLMHREGLDARTTQSLVRLQASAERASRMVKDLLDFTQARLGGGLRMERRPADLHHVTRGVVEEVEIAWPTRTLELRHEGDAQGEFDADRLAQAVQNLVTNALKYSPEGTLVRITTRGEDAEVSLSVTNQGPPIPTDKRMSLFEPMQRATEELDKAGRSVGLGLYIVKNIVEAHGGHVDVVSTLEEGTRFTVHLPRHGRGPQ